MRGHIIAVLIGLSLSMGMQAERICLRQDEQTALLQQIAAQTKAPVSVQVSGFSPEAQQVFNAAVKPKTKAI
jgi:LAS superfamily LD-carboxypeptidase LdcB